MCLSCVHDAKIIGQNKALLENYETNKQIVLEDLQKDGDYSKWDLFIKNYPSPPIEPIIPGFWLEISQKDVFNEDGYNEYPKGSYGLVECNSPSFILRDITPLPLPGFSDETNDDYNKGDLLFDENLTENVCKLQHSIQGDIFSCEKFIQGCMEAGWNRKSFENKDPYSICIYEWFLDHLYHFLVKYGELNV